MRSTCEFVRSPPYDTTPFGYRLAWQLGGGTVGYSERETSGQKRHGRPYRAGAPERNTGFMLQRPKAAHGGRPIIALLGFRKPLTLISMASLGSITRLTAAGQGEGTAL